MAIYRGTGGSGSSTTDSYASEISDYAQTAIDKAQEASDSAQAAALSADQANDSATLSGSSAANASTSASNAAASEANAAASYDNFDDRYLGSKPADPNLDNDGDALLTGALYFNSTTNHMKVYNGSSWVAAYVSSDDVTLDSVTTNNNTTGNTITVGGISSTGNITAPNLNINNWDTAYSWGNHSDANYLTSFTELDPTVPSYVKAITQTEINNWNAAYGWGDHSTAGYLTSYIDTNNYVNSVVFAAGTGVLTLNRDGLSALTVNLDGRYLTSYTETDTLDSVTGRGSSTSNSVTLGGLHVDSTDAVEMPVGTDAQRPTPVTGMLRFNTTSTSFEGYDGSAWGAIGGGGGASGGGGDAIFYENDQTITTDYTIVSSRNAMTTGPVSINSGVTLTVETGARLVII